MKFRPVRGNLRSAMEECVDIPSLKSLSEHIKSKTSEISFESQGYDARIGWDSYLIIVNGLPVGYTDGNNFN